MNRPAPALADLQQWSEEVARDPTSLAFLPLAQAYRRQGRRDAALRLCLRGLERHPENIDAHTLLALLHLEGGDQQRACDEWAFVLRLDPGNFQAHRGMGFHLLERGDYAGARDHLERAAAARPSDPAVREALMLVRQRQAPAPAQPAEEAEPWAAPPAHPPAAAAAPPPAPTPRPSPPAAVPARPAAPPPGGAEIGAARDPERVFEAFLTETPFLGALVLDDQGLVLAGTFAAGGVGRAEAIGAILVGALDEAGRTAAHLALGAWKSIVLESAQATVHLSPLGGSYILLFAARRAAPMGWVIRTAARAGELARRFLERSP